VQALSSAGDLVIPSRKAEMHPRIEWQRYKIGRNSVHVLTRLTRSGRCKPMSVHKGKIGSDRRAVKVVVMTHKRHFQVKMLRFSLKPKEEV
jgi:hypothetical protein